MSARSTAPWGLLASLYFAQGLPYGFFTLAVPIILRRDGLSLEAVGTSSLLLLPWAAKALWAPWVDRYADKRMWVLGLQLASVMVFVGLGLWTAPFTLRLAVGMFLASWLAATQDIATDGWATAVLKPEHRGWGNGVQVAAYRFGMIVGGTGLLVLLDRYGASAAFFAMAALVALTTVPVGFAQPPTSQVQPGPIRLWDSMQALAPWLFALALVKAGDAAASHMVKPYFVDMGWSIEQLAWGLGLGGSAFGLVGALLGGLVVVFTTRRLALVFTLSAQAVTVGLLALALALATVDHTWVLVAVWVEDLGSGMATAAVFTVMMDRCRPGWESTDYTVQASWLVIAVGMATALSGVSAGALGYEGHLVLCTLLAVVAAIVVAFVPLNDHRRPGVRRMA